MSNNTIYPPEESWRFSDGTTMSDDSERDPFSDNLLYSNDKCTECIGFTMNLNVQPYVQLIAVLMMRIMLKQKKSY